MHFPGNRLRLGFRESEGEAMESMWKSWALKEIEGLDSVRDHQRIVFLSCCYEFPFDTTRSLELALFRTFALAKGTPLLASTGELTRRTQKRYDDTYLIISEILENGYDSPRGRAALRRMNRMHGHYTIPNDEFLYTLSTFVFEPLRWNARFGWRPVTEKEKLAGFEYWRQLGRRMNIKEIPDALEVFEAFNVAYEKEHYRYTDTNHEIAAASRDMMLGWLLPPPLRRFGAPFLHAVLDDATLDAVGFERPAPWVRKVVTGTLRLRSRIMRLLPRRRKPYLFTRRRMRTYPRGYEVEKLGVFFERGRETVEPRSASDEGRETEVGSRIREL